MFFKLWLLNELNKPGYRAMAEDAVQQIWKVINIPEHPSIPITEALVEWDEVRDLFTATSMTDFYRWVQTYASSFEPGRLPEKITRGQMGVCAFFGNSVFKFTSQKSEGEIAALLCKHPIPEVAIRDVVFVAKKSIYCIAQDRIQTEKIPNELVTAAWIVGDYIDSEHSVQRKSPFKNIGVKGASLEARNRFTDNVKNNDAVKLFVEMLMKIVSEIERKTGRVYNDLGGGNVGLKGNKPALFDMGGNYITKRKPVPFIRQI